MVNVQVFVLIHWSIIIIIIIIIIFLFVYSGETGRNSRGGSCKEEIIVKKEDVICDHEIQLSLFTWHWKKHLNAKAKKIINGGTTQYQSKTT